MRLVEEFFAPWERDVESFDEINELLTRLFERWVGQGRMFAWRGVVHAAWPLHSSLYRRLQWTSKAAKAPDEKQLYSEEGRLLSRVHQWGLHNGERGRLSVLEQLATLQHFGAPTRLVDVTLNAYIGLWFAVEPKHQNGQPVFEDSDGRLFAVDITDRLINEDDDHRAWEDATTRPWADLDPRDWLGTTWAWRPPPFEARIASQHGAFLFGGVPRSGLGLRWPKGPGAGSGSWHVDDVRRCTSLPLRVHKAEPGGGGVRADGQPVYTFRIKSAAKKDIRNRLRQVFAYAHETIYPDYPGFADFGMPHLATSQS